MRRLRILIVAYYFPPLNSTASHRPYSWAAAWSKAGHEIHVLTTEKYAFDGVLDLGYTLEGITVHEVGYLKAPRAPRDGGSAGALGTVQRWDRLKLATRRVRLGAGMFGEIAWLAYRPLLRRALGLAQQRPFDFLISTSPPEAMHFVAHALSRRTGTPWIADYRDLWFSEMRVNQFRASAWLTGQIKRPRLRQAAAVSTVSEGLAQRLAAFLGRDAIVCYNGFMPLPAPSAPRPWNDAKRHIVYTGRLFPEKRDPRRFFEGLRLAMRADPRSAEHLVVDLYGFDDAWIRDLIAAHGVQELVVVHGLVSHAQSLAAQRHADALLFVDWMDQRAEGILTGKLFEYLASGRRILSVGSRLDTEANRIIAQAGAGAAVCTAEEVRDELLRLLRPEQAAPPPGPAPLIERYSRLVQAEAFLGRIAERIGCDARQ